MSKPVGPRPARQLAADGIGQRGHRLRRRGHRLDALVIELQAIQHGAGEPARRPPPCPARWRRGCRARGADGPAAAAESRGPRLRPAPGRSAPAASRAARRAARIARSSAAIALSRVLLPAGVMRSAPGRRGGSSRRGHGSRGWPRFHRLLWPMMRVARRRRNKRRARAPASRPVAVADAHGVAALEAAFDGGDAGGQQALARGQRLQRRRRPRSALPDRLEGAGDPALARGAGLGGGQEPGAARALGDGGERMEPSRPRRSPCGSRRPIAMRAAASLVTMPPEL